MTTGLKEAILQLKEAILGPCSHWQKKSVLQSSHGRTGFFFLENPDLGAGLAPMPGRWRGRVASLSLEGVSQMVYILPERLPALVRPAFDLVLRRIQNAACRREAAK